MTAQVVCCHPGAVGSCAARGGAGRGQEEEPQPGTQGPGDLGPSAGVSPRCTAARAASLREHGVSEAPHALCDSSPLPRLPAQLSWGEGAEN